MILIEDGRAVGIRLKDGYKDRAQTVVVATGESLLSYYRFYRRWIPFCQRDRTYCYRLHAFSRPPYGQ